MMKKLLILTIFLFTPFIIFSQNINGRFSSSVYTFQRYDSFTESDSLDQSTTFLRTFQSLALNVNEGNYSLRTRVNLESNIGDALENDPRLRFYNLFFEARKLFDMATVRIGRISDFNGVGSGVYDGAYLKVKDNGWAVSGYYGANVPAYQKLEVLSFKDNFVANARIDITALQDFKFTLNYINKNYKAEDYTATRLDESFNPVEVLIRRNSKQYQLLTGKVSYFKNNFLSVNTRYEYDLNHKETSKFEFVGTYRQIENLGISLYYNYYEPRIRYNSIFSVFNYGNTKEIEGGLDYKINKLFTVIGKFANVTYKDEDSQRLTLGVNWNCGNLSYRKTFGYAGELDAISLSLARSFMESLITPSLGISYSSYKLSKDSEKNTVTTFLAGLNYRPWYVASFDLQGQYLNNRIYKNDFRVLFKFNFWFNSNL